MKILELAKKLAKSLEPNAEKTFNRFLEREIQLMKSQIKSLNTNLKTLSVQYENNLEQLVFKIEDAEIKYKDSFTISNEEELNILKKDHDEYSAIYWKRIRDVKDELSKLKDEKKKLKDDYELEESELKDEIESLHSKINEINNYSTED